MSSVEKEIDDGDRTDSPHPALHKTESVTDLQEEIEAESTDLQLLANASSDPERQKKLSHSHMKAPVKVDSAPVTTKVKKDVPPHPTESDSIRAQQSPACVSFCEDKL